MAIALQVLYPAHKDSRFDSRHYTDTHVPDVVTQLGPALLRHEVTLGLTDPEGGPPPFHATATLVFADAPTMTAALAAAGDLGADLDAYSDAAPLAMVAELAE